MWGEFEGEMSHHIELVEGNQFIGIGGSTIWTVQSVMQLEKGLWRYEARAITDGEERVFYSDQIKQVLN